MKRVFFILAIICCAGIFSCQETALRVDECSLMTFTVENALDEDVELVCPIKGKEYSVKISSAEKYSYWQDVMCGNFEESKVPLFEADAMTVKTADGLSVDIDSEALSSAWKQIDQENMVMIIDGTLFETQK